jgi:LPXTG-motif cell wall-anchored protein
MQPGAPDIRDIKPLVELPRHTSLTWLMVALGVLALVALALWWWRRRRRAEAAVTAAPLPADVIAVRALRALRDDLAAGRLDVHPFYFALSGVVRAYVEGRYGLNATDLTTEEIRARVAERAELAPAVAADLVALLDAADWVKFGRAPATVGDGERACERARRLVESTRAVEPTAPPRAVTGGA